MLFMLNDLLLIEAPHLHPYFIQLGVLQKPIAL
jgi:hypothetical protein